MSTYIIPSITELADFRGLHALRNLIAVRLLDTVTNAPDAYEVQIDLSQQTHLHPHIGTVIADLASKGYSVEHAYDTLRIYWTQF